MKTTMIFLIGLLIAPPIFADEGRTNDPREKAANRLPEKQMVKGVIEEVKLLTVTIKPNDGKVVPLAVNEKTIVKRRGQRISVKDLKVGEIVRATFMLQEDQKVALQINVVSK